jgi:two-component system catabolic regulation response regulator CreB
MKKILLIEDENTIAENLKYVFESEGFQFSRARTAHEGLELLAGQKFDVLILDVGLPDKNGFEVCKEIRLTNGIPIFFLTARSEEIDRIVGLEIGGDDYITKPFSPREVVARINAFFRRFQQKKTGQTVTHGQFEILEDRFEILFRGDVLDLRRYEFGILKLLVENPGRVYSREQIMEKVWSVPDMSLERTVDTHVKVIRSKLKNLTDDDLIQTHRGLGYSLKEN